MKQHSAFRKRGRRSKILAGDEAAIRWRHGLCCLLGAISGALTLLAAPVFAAPPTIPEPPPLIRPKIPPRLPGMPPLDGGPKLGPPGSAEDSLRYTYRSVCNGHSIVVNWAQEFLLGPRAAHQVGFGLYAVSSIEVAIDDIALDPDLTEKLLNFLNNIAGRQSKKWAAKNNYYIINGVSALCWPGQSDVNLIFYYSTPNIRAVFGEATVIVDRLKAELTEGEGPDPLDGVPLDTDGKPDGGARQPWGLWSDAFVPP